MRKGDVEEDHMEGEDVEIHRKRRKTSSDGGPLTASTVRLFFFFSPSFSMRI
jgi:hypothetical protein